MSVPTGTASDKQELKKEFESFAIEYREMVAANARALKKSEGL